MTAVSKKAAQPKTRGVTWVYSRECSRRLIEDGIPCPMIIRVGTDTWCYLVERHGQAWRMTHVLQDDSGCCGYVVHLGLPVWCDCPSHRYGRGGCKHVAALRAALNAIGVEP